MEMFSMFKRAGVLLPLARRRKVRLGSSIYRVQSFFPNPIAQSDPSEVEAHEPWLDSVLRAVLTCRQGAFLDVGANIGQTMLKILAIEKTRQYVGFEPQVSCSFVIHRFIRDNDLKNFVILPFGLFTENRIVRIQLRGGDSDTASIIENFRPISFYTSQEYVCVRRGDEVVTELNLQSVAVLKIDVEGAELEIIEGLSNTIREHKPFIIFEVLNSYLAVTGERLDDSIIEFRAKRTQRMEAILRDQGYEIFNILPQNILRRVDSIQPSVSADLSLTNYLAVPAKDTGFLLQVMSA